MHIAQPPRLSSRSLLMYFGYNNNSIHTSHMNQTAYLPNRSSQPKSSNAIEAIHQAYQQGNLRILPVKQRKYPNRPSKTPPMSDPMLVLLIYVTGDFQDLMN
ncbi:hypothetical protein EB796_021012 [Bugula neritina]|uniref:Uncharacterized protein n=1 Tax=Bugula neritina TaxID=10212 RepID=A0A7J7J3A3_BUGNE|nr:hypothetical protein EB796_021012 [Bugula neritina]